MYVCVLDGAGAVLVYRNVASTPAAFLEIVAPYRTELVVAAECMFTWYWLADVCAAEGITFVLGHALAMKAIHGGKAKNDMNRTWGRHYLYRCQPVEPRPRGRGFPLHVHLRPSRYGSCRSWLSRRGWPSSPARGRART